MRDIKNHMEEATRQLGATTFYKKFPTKPTLERNTKINTVTNNFKKQNLITKTHHLKFTNQETMEDLVLIPSTHTREIYMTIPEMKY